jgi:hypothetical protein
MELIGEMKLGSFMDNWQLVVAVKMKLAGTWAM